MNSRDTQYRQEIEALSRFLLQLHKSLMDVQKNIQAKMDGKHPSPHELLSFLISHPNFEWLRILSGRIVKIDEATDSKDTNFALLRREIATDLKVVFFLPGPFQDFQEKLVAACDQDETLLSKLVLLREKLDALAL